MKGNSTWLKQLGALLLWLILWHLLSLRLHQEILLVSPLKVLQRLSQLCGESSFWLAVGNSLRRILLGFALACVGGIILAAASLHPFVYTVLAPVLSLMKATPVASVTILVLFWVPSSNLAVVIAFMMVLPIIYYNVYEGLHQVDKQLLEMAAVFRLSPWKRIRYLITPSVLPYFISACSVGFGQAWKSGIAAEVIALPRQSIGINLYNAKVYLSNADLLAWTVVIVLLSLAMEKTLLLLMARSGLGGLSNGHSN